MKFGSAATKKVLKRAALKSKVYYKKHRALNTLDGRDHRHGEAESLRRSSRARVVNNKRGIVDSQQRQTLNGSAQQTKKRGREDADDLPEQKKPSPGKTNPSNSSSDDESDDGSSMAYSLSTDGSFSVGSSSKRRSSRASSLAGLDIELPGSPSSQEFALQPEEANFDEEKETSEEDTDTTAAEGDEQSADADRSPPSKETRNTTKSADCVDG